MSKKKNVDPDKIHLLDVKVVKGNIDVGDDLQEGTLDNFSIHFDIEDSFQIEEKLVRILFAAKFKGFDKEEQLLPLSAEFTFDFVFQVDNLDDYIVSLDKENQTVDVDSTLGHSLIAIVYSTARGIILTRTQGTAIKNGILLPVINTRNLLQKLVDRDGEQTHKQPTPEKSTRNTKSKAKSP